MGTPRPKPLLEALTGALERISVSPDHKTGVLKAMTPYAFAHEALLRLLDHASDLFCISGVDGRLRHVNKAFQNALGYTSEELTSRPLLDFVHPNDVEITRSKIEKLRAGLDVVRFENRWKAKDETWKRFSWTCPAPPEGNNDLFALARIVPEP